MPSPLKAMVKYFFPSNVKTDALGKTFLAGINSFIQFSGIIP